MITELGKFIKKLRIEKSITQKDLSNKIGISGAYLSAIENGQRDISTKILSQMKSFFDLKPNDYTKLLLLSNKDRKSFKFSGLSGPKKDLISSLYCNIDYISLEKYKSMLKIIEEI